jgi:hypothetical protein
MKTPLFLLIASLALAVSSLQAADANKILSKGDKDGDGKLSAEEFSALIPDDPEKAAKRFKKIDHDNDGFASLEELKVFYEKN